MKHFYKLTAVIVALIFTTSMGAEEKIVLNLTQPANPETFEFNNDGTWCETYNDVDYTYWESQIFMFAHLIDGEGSSWGGLAWNGYTVSKNASDASADDLLTTQWGCMAKGGIASVNDGNVSVDAERPYIVAFYNSYATAGQSLSILFNDGNTYTPMGMYVTNSPYPYYTNISGNDFANGLTKEGDYFKIIAHGVQADGNEVTTEFILSEFKNGTLTQVTDWTWFDLTPLGNVQEIYFTLESSDIGDYGMNTPGYFCIDRLTVSGSETQGIEDNKVEANTNIFYANNVVTITSEREKTVYIYSINGAVVMTQIVGEGISQIDIHNLPKGIYIVKAGNEVIKISK